MVVRIDMDMPKCCNGCCLSYYDEVFKSFICSPSVKMMTSKQYWDKNKPSWCPLKECE